MFVFQEGHIKKLPIGTKLVSNCYYRWMQNNKTCLKHAKMYCKRSYSVQFPRRSYIHFFPSREVLKVLQTTQEYGPWYFRICRLRIWNKSLLNLSENRVMSQHNLLLVKQWLTGNWKTLVSRLSFFDIVLVTLMKQKDPTVIPNSLEKIETTKIVNKIILFQTSNRVITVHEVFIEDLTRIWILF